MQGRQTETAKTRPPKPVFPYGGGAEVLPVVDLFVYLFIYLF